MTTPETPPAQTLRPAMVALMVIWFGVLTGVIELGYLGYEKLVQENFIWVSRQVFWMAPLGNVLYGGVAALLVLVATRFKPGVFGLAALLSGIGILSLFLMFGALHPLASIALGLGLGLQVGKIAQKRGEGFTRLVRRTAPVLAGLVVLLGIGSQIWLSMGRPGLADAPSGKPPNVLLITMDTVRADSLSLYGYERATTPELEKLAGRGLLFRRAIAPAPWTLPTHASLFTGRFPHQLSVDWLAPLDDANPTLAEALRDHGYATAGFASNLNYCSTETGLSRGFVHYEDYPLSLGQIVLSTALGRSLTNSTWFREMLDWHENLNRVTAEDLNAAFSSWVSGVEGRPFFAFINYYDGHQPYLPPPEFADKFVEKPVRRTGFRYDTNLIEIEDWYHLAPEQIRMEQDCYDAAIAYMDAQIGALVQQLEERGLLDDTLVIITSDHGEQFGEHELYNHGNSLYLTSTHVPLLMLFPDGSRAGTAVDSAVSLRDLPATILEMAGVDGAGGLEGHSLARFWAADSALDDVPNIVLSEVRVLEGQKRRGDMVSLFAGRYHFIRNGDGSFELYDIDYDPQAVRDLASLDNAAEAVARFAEALDLILER